MEVCSQVTREGRTGLGTEFQISRRVSRDLTRPVADTVTSHNMALRGGERRNRVKEEENNDNDKNNHNGDNDYDKKMIILIMIVIRI